jgi:short-subunit dehydrogenase
LDSKFIQIIKIDFENKLEFSFIKDVLKKTDVLINNVGIMTGRKYSKYSYEDIITIFNINLFSAFFLIKSFLSGKLNDINKRKTVINISSIAGTQGSPDIPYAMTKSAMNILGESLSQLYKNNKNIIIHTLIFGPIDTNMIDSVGMDDRRYLSKHTVLTGKPIDKNLAVDNIIYLIENNITDKKIILSNGAIWKN